jgi:hypothetical protein
MISLSDGTTTLELPADMLWQDELAWNPVAQTSTPTLTGSIIVQSAQVQAGRPITLQSGDEYAWITKTQLDQLRTWAAVAGQELTLSYRGDTFDVVMRHQDKAIEAAMVMYHASPTATDYYRATVRLMEV